MDTEIFDAVCLSGAGTKGIIILGTLHFFYETGKFQPDKTYEYAGTSVGGIISLLLICGYTPKELFDFVYSIDKFFDTEDFDFNAFTIVKETGILSMDGLAEKVSNLVKEKLGEVPTLQRLKEITGKSLSVCVLNATKMKEEKYSAETRPKLNCVNAIKMTCCLPPFFKRLKYNGDYIVDGGLINNFPWEYISNERTNVLGIVIRGKDDTYSVENPVGYFYRLSMISSSTLTKLRCKTAPPRIKIIKIKWSGAPFLQFSMTPQQKVDMFLEGYEKAENNQKE